MKFTIPVINEEAYFIEIPNKMLIVVFKIWESGTNYPAFAVLVPQTINSEDDMTNLDSSYFYLEAKRISEGEYSGLYELQPAGLVVTPSNATMYNGEPTNLVTNGVPVPIYFSNEKKACYAVIIEEGTEHTNYFFANKNTFVLDRGINRGFAFGAKMATTQPTLDQLAGTYVFMNFNQKRNQGQTNLYDNNVIKGIAKLSNTGTLLDVYVGTNESSLTKVDTINFLSIKSYDNKIPQSYCLISTNASESPLIIVLGEDLTYAFMVQDTGEATNTNDYYRAQFGFIKKRQSHN